MSPERGIEKVRGFIDQSSAPLPSRLCGWFGLGGVGIFHRQLAIVKRAYAEKSRNAAALGTLSQAMLDAWRVCVAGCLTRFRRFR
jgi:hypothetical protein